MLVSIKAPILGFRVQGLQGALSLASFDRNKTGTRVLAGGAHTAAKQNVLAHVVGKFTEYF